jgi:hypothetical protein
MCCIEFRINQYVLTNQEKVSSLSHSISLPFNLDLVVQQYKYVEFHPILVMLNATLCNNHIKRKIKITPLTLHVCLFVHVYPRV